MTVTTGALATSAAAILFVLGFRQQRLLVGGLASGVHDLHPDAQLVGNEQQCLVAHRLGHGHHLAETEQRLDHLGGGPPRLVGEILDRDAVVHLDGSRSSGFCFGLRRINFSNSLTLGRGGCACGGSLCSSRLRRRRGRLGSR